MAAGARRLHASLHRQPCFTAYLVVSAALILLLALDPYLNAPHGLLPLSMFTSLPPSGHADACWPDPEGPWQVGGLTGSSPLSASLSQQPLVSCSTVTASLQQQVSFVSDPYLVLPRSGGEQRGVSSVV